MELVSILTGLPQSCEFVFKRYGFRSGDYLQSMQGVPIVSVYIVV